MSTPPHTKHTQCTPSTVGDESKTMKRERSSTSLVESVGSSQESITHPRKETSRENLAFLSHGLPFMELCMKIFQRSVALGEGARSTGQAMGDSTEMNNENGDMVATAAPSSRFIEGGSSGSRSSGSRKERSSAAQDDMVQTTLDNFNAYLKAKQAKLAKDDDDV